MPQIVPEKTVELWTAHATLSVLAGQASVCSPINDTHQNVWPDDLRQWFILAPTAPEPSPPPSKQDTGHSERSETTPDAMAPCYRINRRQLATLVKRHNAKLIPEVLYILPDPRKRPCNDTDGALLPLAHHGVCTSFATWSFAIRATNLHTLIRNRKARNWARVRWAEDVPDVTQRKGRHKRLGSLPGSLSYLSQPLKKARTVGTRPLEDLLNEIKRAEEPHGITLRAPDLRPQGVINRQPPEDGHVDLALTPDSVSKALHALDDLGARRLLLVALSWEVDDTGQQARWQRTELRTPTQQG